MYELVCRFRSGVLDAELDELTRQHGYGKLHATDGYLRRQPSSTMRHGHHKAAGAKRECDGTHLAPSAMSTFFVEYPCVPHVCVPLHCSWELLFALRSPNMAANIDDTIDELT